ILKEGNSKLRNKTLLQVEKDGDHQSKEDLEEQFCFARYSFTILLAAELGDIIHETYSAKGEERKGYDPNVAVLKIGPEKCGDDGRDEDNETPHCRGARLCPVPFWNILPLVALNLPIVELLDQARG
ncbi:MAG: hypothetical protein H6Q53_971, partial [Deltaproteobacteria bacterium]|nr:hypothetical protein [Deltaproteobacteria bacterium]